MNRTMLLVLSFTTLFLWIPMLSWGVLETFYGCEMGYGMTCPDTAPHNMVNWVPWAILTTPLAGIMTIVLAIYVVVTSRRVAAKRH